MDATLDETAGYSRHGTPGFDRRLTDKILAAFNHAYAAGDLEVARRLHAALAIAADHERRRLPGDGSVERRAGDAVDQAGLWVAYVEARNTYQAAQHGGVAGEEARACFEAMKRAYRRWGEG